MTQEHGRMEHERAVSFLHYSPWLQDPGKAGLESWQRRLGRLREGETGWKEGRGGEGGPVGGPKIWNFGQILTPVPSLGGPTWATWSCARDFAATAPSSLMGTRGQTSFWSRLCHSQQGLNRGWIWCMPTDLPVAALVRTGLTVKFLKRIQPSYNHTSVSSSLWNRTVFPARLPCTGKEKKTALNSGKTEPIYFQNTDRSQSLHIPHLKDFLYNVMSLIT